MGASSARDRKRRDLFPSPAFRNSPRKSRFKFRRAIWPVLGLMLSLLCAVCVAGEGDARAATNLQPKLLHVVLVGGQSNADGRAPGQALPPHLQAAQTNVAFYYYTHGAPTNGDGSLGTLTTLRPGATQMPEGGFGPEVSLGYHLSRVIERSAGAQLAIIKYAKGGSSLAVDWKATGDATAGGDGIYYQVFQRVVRDGLAKLRSAFPDSTVHMAGMIWVQGEQDIDKGSATAAAYGSNLTSFITDIRQTFCPQMPFCFSRISTQQTFYSVPSKRADFLAVRSNQVTVAAALSDTYVIDTDSTDFPTLADGGHFDARGQQALGTAFAAQLAKRLSSPKSEVTAVSRGGARASDFREGVFPFYAYVGRNDIWALTPMDQGGRLVQLQVIGSERDEDIVKAVRAPGFFAPWGEPIRWDSLEKIAIEKSVWLNRWYFLPCFARQAYLTGDQSYLQEILAFIRKWVAENPVPGDLAGYFATKRYNWRDMQVAWRTQNLAWTYFLGWERFTAAERRELFEVMAVHAHVLLEYFGKQPFHENNHQSHGATAMLYAALLFPDLAEAGALRERAFAILNHHLDHAFYEDGNSIELTPGYYPFFASVFRDAYALCRANHVSPPPRCAKRLEEFYHFLSKAAQPNRQMPPINDSTESDPSACLQVLADLLGLPFPYPSAGSHWFSASDQAVMRDAAPSAPAYAFLDAGPRILAHWHGGKLGFHLWYWDRALLVDSGICNYDDPLRRSWYVKAQAHNTVLVDGKGDCEPLESILAGRSMAGSHIVRWESNDRYDWAVMRHTGFQDRPVPVVWVRHFVMLKGVGTLLVDQLESKGDHDYTWLFHLPPCSPVVAPDSKSLFTGFTEKNLLILPATSQALSGPVLTDGTVNRQGRNLAAPVAQYGARAASYRQAYLLLPVAGMNRQVTRLSQAVDAGTFTVTLTGAFGVRRVGIVHPDGAENRDYRLSVEVLTGL